MAMRGRQKRDPGTVFARRVLVLFVAATLASGRYLEGNDMKTDLYVSPSGDDSHPGTRAKPYRTIQKAADEARRGTENGRWLLDVDIPRFAPQNRASGPTGC